MGSLSPHKFIKLTLVTEQISQQLLNMPEDIKFRKADQTIVLKTGRKMRKKIKGGREGAIWEGVLSREVEFLRRGF